MAITRKRENPTPAESKSSSRIVWGTMLLCLLALAMHPTFADLRTNHELEITEYENASPVEKLDKLAALLDVIVDDYPVEALNYYAAAAGVVGQAPPDKRLHILNLVCWAHYINDDEPAAVRICEANLDDAITHGIADEVAAAFNVLGSILDDNENDAEALAMFDKAIKAADSPHLIAAGQSNAGILLAEGGAYELAFERFSLALQASEHPDIDSMSRCYYASPAYSQIGQINRQLGNLDDAVRYFRLALECAEESQTSWDRISSLLNLTNVHLDRGQVGVADELSRRVERAAADLGDPESLSMAAASRAAVLYRQNRHTEAMNAARLALSFKTTAEPSTESVAMIIIVAKIFAVTRDYSEGLKEIAAIEPQIRSMSRDDLLQPLLEVKSQILSDDGQSATALVAMREFIGLSQSRLRAETVQRMQLLQSILDADQQAAAAEEARLLQTAAEARADRADLLQKVTIAAGIVFVLVGYLALSRLHHARQSAQREKTKFELECELSKRTAALQVEAETRVELETQLLQAQKLDAVGQLTGGVAHDFNNLMTVVMGATELACESDKSILHESDRELLQNAYDAAAVGSEITSQLLAFSRKQPLQIKSTELTDLVTRTKSIFNRVLGNRIPMLVSVSDQPLWSEVDRAKLSTALLNLVLNARDAMTKGGEIRVECHREEVFASQNYHRNLTPGAYCRIDVVDTGCGMNAATLERAVEPFFTTKKQGQGNGLGLSMVYGLVRQSQGHFEIRSEVDKGTTASVFLPLCPAPAELAIPSPVMTAIPMDKSKTKVLIIEDQANVRHLAKRVLKRLGYSVDVAANGSEARDLLISGYRPTTVFSDVSMPGEWNGIRLAHWLRNYAPEVHVLLTSGYPQDELKDSGIAFIEKPYQPDELDAAIGRLSAMSPTFPESPCHRHH